MGYAVIMFIIMLLMAVSIALSANYGISKDSQKAPLLAENAYADKEGGKMQTDFVVNATKVNGTMSYTNPMSGNPNELNLYLSVQNTGSFILNPLKYSILLNNTFVPINSASDNSTPPLKSSSTKSYNVTIRPSNLVLSSENGVKIIIPTAPKITYIDITLNNTGDCGYYDATITWVESYGEVWPITKYKLYYTNTTDLLDKNYAQEAFTVGPETSSYVGAAFRTPGGGSKCDVPSGDSKVWVWITAFDTHGNEGVPSNTCGRGVGGGTFVCG